MTTFKVGDKVEILNAEEIELSENHFDTGDIVEVVAIHKEGRPTPILKGKRTSLNHELGGLLLTFRELQFIRKVEPKPTKNQRITALEEKVKYLESVVDSLTHKKWTEDDLNELEAQVLTNNQKRKAIIEKAKKFVKDNLNNSSIKRNYFPADGIYKQKHRSEFVVNPEKRTVVFLIHNLNSKYTRRSIAKCHPNDVFNEHIGKAIAFGKKFGLDVSEFEQAVQPDEVVVGMQAVVTGMTSEYTTTVCESDEGLKRNENSLGFIKANPWFFKRITNDTDAGYN